VSPSVLARRIVLFALASKSIGALILFLGFSDDFQPRRAAV
jgi:hypothetical protein